MTVSNFGGKVYKFKCKFNNGSILTVIQSSVVIHCLVNKIDLQSCM